MKKANKNYIRSNGHLLRRCVHLSLTLIPVFYYCHGIAISAYFFLTRERLVSLIVFLAIILECLRLYRRWNFFGQRIYEIKYISAAFWAVFSIGLVLLAAPKIGNYGAGFGAPLIWALSLGDVLMGEVRLAGFSNYIIAVVGTFIIAIVWITSSFFFLTPLWVIPLLVPITVASELLSLSWIDDNATMLLLPLSVIILLSPWIK